MAATPPTPCYLDEDEDEYATLVTSPTPAQAQNCKAVEAFKAGNDCDDTNPRSFPGAPERCGEPNTNCDESDDVGPVECLRGAMKTAKIGLKAKKSKSWNSVDVTVTIEPTDLCEYVKVGFGTVKPNTYGVALKPANATVSCHLVSSGSAAGESNLKSCGARGFDKDAISDDSGELVVGAQCCVSEGKSSHCEDIGETFSVSYKPEHL